MITTLACALIFFERHALGELNAHDYSVEIITSLSENPPSITLQWLADANATGYVISRKPFGASAWTQVGSGGTGAVSWVDSNVTMGAVYEYQVVKTTGPGHIGYGYVCSAIKRPAVESRGKMILVVENDLATALPMELARLQQDLTGDGWIVVRRDVLKNLTAPEVKQVIKTAYQADPGNTRGLFIFGHVAVPYSGNIGPDVHPDHTGGWPADVYYAEFDGTWTDSTVNVTYTTLPNVPGDGKFDSDRPPGLVRLQMGRVDLSSLTCFANKTPSRSELDLARQYLTKNHNFKHGVFETQRRAVVFDRFYRGLEAEPQTCAAWRSFPAFFGHGQVRTIGPDEYFPILNDNPYLWSYVVSGGGPYKCDFIGTSDSWALNAPKVVFASFLGSYFGDWNRESNFLRAPLGSSGHTLATIFSGQPQWLLHTMGMGEPIGHAAQLTQNNPPGGTYPPQGNAGAGEVHIALMGDPSLRMHVVKPASNLTGTVDSNGVLLEWRNSPDRSVLGYYVYKGASESGPFTRISGANWTTATTFQDAGGNAADYYMVRAVRLETNPSGSYYNLSQGIFYPDSAASAPPTVPQGLSVSSIQPGSLNLTWNSPSSNVRAFEVQRRTLPNGVFVKIGEAETSSSSYKDTTLSAGQYAYRVKALGFAGDSDFSGETVINLQPSVGAIVGNDTTTGGNWIGKYGRDGYEVLVMGNDYPDYATMIPIDTYLYSPPNPPDDSRVLRAPASRTRKLASWVNAGSSTVKLSFRFADSLKHRVAIYLYDFDAKRAVTVRVIDPFTGRTNGVAHYGDYSMGLYTILEMQNYSDVLLTAKVTNGVSTVLISGIFFDTPPGAPTITPNSGPFAGKATVTMTSTPGATIRYTTDGTAPGANAFTYAGPFTLRTNAVIKAKAILNGFTDSDTATVSLTNNLISKLAFVGIDATTQGDWKAKYGSAGEAVPAWSNNLPEFLDWNVSVGTPWTWSTSATEIRALKKYTGSERVATCWYSTTEGAFDLQINSPELRQVALYFMDWDGGGRVQDITITDSSGALVLTQRLSDFGGGKYLVFNARGSFQIRAKKIAGPNAILNGVFVGNIVAMNPAPPQLEPRPNIAGGSYTIRVKGQPGQVFEVQSSVDLRAWTPIGSTTISENSADVVLPINSAAGPRFFRTMLTP